MPNSDEIPRPTDIRQLEPEDTGPDRPRKPEAAPIEKAENVHNSVYWLWRDRGHSAFVSRIAAVFAGSLTYLLGIFTTIVIWALVNLGAPVASAVIEAIGKARKELSPEAAVLAAEVLNELTGADYSPADIPTGKEFRAHVERARVIGARLHEVLITEFAPNGALSPQQGRDAAARFSGFVTNFAVSTALLGILGELETLGTIEEFRELGVEVARNLALGRLHRLALRPLIQTLISTPLEWSLHKTYHPKMLSEAQAVRAFHARLIDEATLFEELERTGLSAERIRAVMELGREHLGTADLELLIRYGVLTRGDAAQRLSTKGFTTDDAELLLTVEDLRRIDGHLREHIRVLREQRENGVLDPGQFDTALAALPITEEERHTIRVITETKLELPRKFLTLRQMQDAFDEGVANVEELDEFLVREGYSRDDQQILRLLTLLKLADRTKAVHERDARRTARDNRAKSKLKPGQPPA